MEIGAIKETSAAANDARWIDDLPGLPGVSLKVRPMSCSIIARAMGRELRKATNTEGDIGDDVFEDIDRRVLTQYAVVDWQGLTSSGAPVQFDDDVLADLTGSELFFAAVKVAVVRAQDEASAEISEMAKNW